MWIFYTPDVTKIILMTIIVRLGTVTIQGSIKLCWLYSQSLGLIFPYCLQQIEKPNTRTAVTL